MYVELLEKPKIDSDGWDAFFEWVNRAAEFVDLVTQATLGREEVVYFVVAGSFVKIGKCTGHPKARMAQLQTGCPYEMDLKFWLPGGTDVEHRFHRRFIAQALYRNCEWFKLEGELADFVSAAEDFRLYGRASLESEEAECSN